MTFCTTELQDITDAKLFQVPTPVQHSPCHVLPAEYSCHCDALPVAQMNTHLLNRTYVAANVLTLADLLLFSQLSEAMVCCCSLSSMSLSS